MVVCVHTCPSLCVLIWFFFFFVPDENFLQKGAPSTALQNSEPAGLILENSAEAKQVHQKETLSVLGFLLHSVPRSFPTVFSSSLSLSPRGCGHRSIFTLPPRVPGGCEQGQLSKDLADNAVLSQEEVRTFPAVLILVRPGFIL